MKKIQWVGVVMLMMVGTALAEGKAVYIACPKNLTGTFVNLQTIVNQGGYNWTFMQLPFNYNPTKLTLSNGVTTNQVTVYVPSAAPTIVCQGAYQGSTFQFYTSVPKTCPFHTQTNSYHVVPSEDGKGWTCS